MGYFFIFLMFKCTYLLKMREKQLIKTMKNASLTKNLLKKDPRLISKHLLTHRKMGLIVIRHHHNVSVFESTVKRPLKNRQNKDLNDN